MLRLTHRLSFLSLSILLANTTAHAEFSPTPLPFLPRVLGEGFFGDRTLGEADAMLPLYGNGNGILYLDGLGKTGSDDGTLGSIGGGYRGIHNESFLWGAYVFGDFNRVARGPHFPVVNPGLEFMTNHWDIHVNGYFPTSPKQKVEATFLGEQLGTTQYISFTGHSQFDNLVNLVEEVGNGVDGEVGLTLPAAKYLRLYTGGYHFSFKEARDINGVIGGVEMPLNNYFTVSIRDSYDRVQKNTAQVTIRLTLGGMVKGEQPNVHERLLDPIPRHLGTWDTGSGIPSQQAYVNTGVRVLTRDNIWFFSNAGTPFVAANGFSNCTFENNCLDTSFTQPTVDAIDSISPGANLYLGPGTYNSLSGSSSFAPHNLLLSQLILNERQSLYGRSADFTVRQLRPVIGNLNLQGNNTYDSLWLLNENGQFFEGLTITGSNVRISNSVIGENNSARGYRTAVSMEDADNVLIENSHLTAFTEDSNTAVGVLLGIVDNIRLVNDTITVNATRQTANPVTGVGIVINQSFGITLANSQINVQANNPTGQNATAEGIRLDGSNVTMSNSRLSINAASTGGSTATARGIFASGKMSISNSSVSANSVNNGTNGISRAIGYETQGVELSLLKASGTVNAQATSSGSSAEAIGLLEGAASIVTTNQVELNSTATATNTATASGIVIDGLTSDNKSLLLFTGIRLNSQATAGLSSVAQGISASRAIIDEILNSGNIPASSFFTAKASSPGTATAFGVALEQEGEFYNLEAGKLSAATRDYYSISATNTTASTATGFLANIDSKAILYGPTFNLQATTTRETATGPDSSVLVCGIFSIIAGLC